MGIIPPSILSQPPAPPRLLPAAGKEERKTEVVGGNIHSYYLRSFKRKILLAKKIDSLPDEVWFEVLVRLPAQDIYDLARLVCSKWYHMIHTHTFIHAHLQHSTYGLLFQSTVQGDSFFMSMGESSGRIEIISNYRYKFRSQNKTSCNGLMLEYQKGNHDNLYISNPATSQIFVLPPLVGQCHHCGLYGLAYAVASMEYKAVLQFHPIRDQRGTCYILTIGVDNSWRPINTECVSVAVTRAFGNPPVITEGFMHWHHSRCNEILTLNVETEKITETRTPIPRVVYQKPQRIVYLSTGRYLTKLIPVGGFCWEVWEMKPKIDFLWRKVCDISLEASTFERLDLRCWEFVMPVGWLKYPEVLVFTVNDLIRRFVYVYNLLTRDIDTIELRTTRVHYSIVLHKNSLEWLGGC